MRFFALIITLFGFISSAQAQIISTTQPLSFGEAVVTRNDSVYSMSVGTDNSVLSDPEFLIIDNPVPGIYQYTGGTPFDPITSVDIVVNTNPNAGGGTFTLDDFSVDFPATLDVNGDATITVGARLNTSGNGVNYNGSTTFNGSLDMTVNF